MKTRHQGKYLTRSNSSTIRDLDVMAEALDRLSHAQYAKPYFEKRYSQALERVIEDLGKEARVVDLIVTDKRVMVDELRRIVANKSSSNSDSRDTPTTQPPDLIRW